VIVADVSFGVSWRDTSPSPEIVGPVVSSVTDTVFEAAFVSVPAPLVLVTAPAGSRTLIVPSRSVPVIVTRYRVAPV